MPKLILPDLPIVFESEKIRLEWYDPRLSTCVKVQAINTAWLVFKLTGEVSVITCIHRTDERQHEICKQAGIDYYPSPHPEWNAIDQVPESRRIDPGVAIEIKDRINLIHPYSGTPGKKSCLFHDIGLGPHFHNQCKNEPRYKPQLTV